ncbi:MAG: MBL fold metallo-hydrolase [Candidatus Lokiarchaeota archaeon]|nr:MBL fold metallo-hydrolase [Candidatus Lokiarchaeota archaeon]
MKLIKIRSEGLAHISYLLISENQACVIDPRRDAKIYIKKAYENDADIKYVFETHRNEDYIIGSLELVDIMDLDIYHGPGLEWEYGKTLKDGQVFHLGGLRLEVLLTPGHTDESVSYAVYDTITDTGDDAVLVFTGDALFVGDVGRTDMYGREEDRRMAENLYNSLFNKILPLGDQAIVCPAHGAGSVCGGNISEREDTTIGLERKHNKPLQIKDKEEFIKYKINEHHYFLPYFKKMEEYNLKGAPLLKDVPRFKPMNPKEFMEKIDEAVILDTRNPDSFGAAHIKDSYNIWLEGLASFAGWFLPYDKPLLLVVKNFNNLNEAHKRLLRIGYDNLAGYLIGGITSWYSNNFPIESNGLLTARDLKDRMDQDINTFILDVRSIDERKEGYIEGSKHIYVGELEKQINQVPKDTPIATLCGNGSRASLGTSILKRGGFQEVYTVLGSMKAWKKSQYPIVK